MMMVEKKEMIQGKKMMAALFCGMLGCVFMGSGDWLMMYGDVTSHGNVYWLTEGVAQISPERNLLSMLVAFPAVILYGIGLFAVEKFIKPDRPKRIYHYLTALGMLPWLCIHLYVVMILYTFAMMSRNGYEAAIPMAEAMRAQFLPVLFIGEALMVLPFLYWFYLQISAKTVFPKGMAFTNVLIIYGVLQVVKSVLPDSPFRIGFANGLMSESMILWFGIMLVWVVFSKNRDMSK
ncbi:MAG: hypothetical protein NC251_08255 [Lachnoclostridium sp.]|nr:hypothetical protein [Lachnospira sp.]MCM1248406.1 hypothetical protein [Lachnoclostridium sp.]